MGIGVARQIGNLPPAVMGRDDRMNAQFDRVVVGLNLRAGADPDSSDDVMSTMSPGRGGPAMDGPAMGGPGRGGAAGRRFA